MTQEVNLPTNLDTDIMQMQEQLLVFGKLYRSIVVKYQQQMEAMKAGEEKIKELVKEIEQLKGKKE